ADGVGDGLHHARGALGALAAELGRPALDRAHGPVGGRRCGEILGEVAGRARLVGGVHGGDVQIRQRRVRVLAGDGGIVPLGDRAVEDLRDGGRVEVQGVYAVEVEDDRDGRDVGGELYERVGGAAVE